MKDAMKKFHAIAVEEFGKLGIKNSKFLGISHKGEEWQFIYRVSSLSQETYWKEGAAIWKKISEENMDKDSGGISLRNSILIAMENKARRVLGSHLAETEMMELGKILESALIPASAREDVAMRISMIAEILSPEGDEKSAHYYLMDLAGRIYLSN